MRAQGSAGCKILSEDSSTSKRTINQFWLDGYKFYCFPDFEKTIFPNDPELYCPLKMKENDYDYFLSENIFNHRYKQKIYNRFHLAVYIICINLFQLS